MSRKRVKYLLFRHFQGLEVVTDDAQLFFKLHDFPVKEMKPDNVSQSLGKRYGKKRWVVGRITCKTQRKMVIFR